MTALSSRHPERGATTTVVLRFRRVPLLLLPVALAVLVGAMAVAAPPALADEPLYTSPSRGEQLHTAPGSVQLGFGGLVRSGSSLDVEGPEGSADLGKERRTGITLTQRLRSDLPAGVYTVTWDVQLQNGEDSQGQYTFIVTTGPDEDEDTPEDTNTISESPTTAAPSPRWTPSTVDDQSSSTAALIAPTNAPTSLSGTGKGNATLGILSLLAAAGISGALFYAWSSGWWSANFAGAPARSGRGRAQTSELPPIRPVGG